MQFGKQYSSPFIGSADHVHNRALFELLLNHTKYNISYTFLFGYAVRISHIVYEYIDMSIIVPINKSPSKKNKKNGNEKFFYRNHESISEIYL